MLPTNKPMRPGQVMMTLSMMYSEQEHQVMQLSSMRFLEMVMETQTILFTHNIGQVIPVT